MWVSLSSVVRRWLVPLAVLLLGGQAIAGTQVVVPNGLADSQGDTVAAYKTETGRLQLVFDAAEFSAITEPQLITAIAFRPGAGQPAFSGTLPNIQFGLSTTSKSVGALSTTFAENVGADLLVVFSGALTFSSAGDTGSIPRPFDAVLTLQTPFLYDPGQGNLLLDIRNFEPGPSFSVEAQVGGPLVASAIDSLDPNAATGEVSTGGLVAQFEFEPASQPTPLPTAVAAGLIGLAMVGVYRRYSGTGQS